MVVHPELAAVADNLFSSYTSRKEPRIGEQIDLHIDGNVENRLADEAALRHESASLS